jgi:membrane protein DedA with SNARE-associated domain
MAVLALSQPHKVNAISLEQIIGDYGLPGLFLGAAVEGETVVVLGGMMVHRGVLPFFPAIVAAAIGSFAADQLFFFLGRAFRHRPFVKRQQRKPAFVKALATFEKHPLLFVFAFRFVYGFRTVSPVAVGTTSLPARTFLVINALAAAVWATLFVSLGYCFGAAIERMVGRLPRLEPIFIGATVVAIAVVCALYLRQSTNSQKG